MRVFCSFDLICTWRYAMKLLPYSARDVIMLEPGSHSGKPKKIRCHAAVALLTIAMLLWSQLRSLDSAVYGCSSWDDTSGLHHCSTSCPSNDVVL
jgi:hypothetical protein